MKKFILCSLVFIQFYGVIAMEVSEKKDASFEKLPVEIKMHIVDCLLKSHIEKVRAETADFSEALSQTSYVNLASEKALKDIATFAQINKQCKNVINHCINKGNIQLRLKQLHFLIDEKDIRTKLIKCQGISSEMVNQLKSEILEIELIEASRDQDLEKIKKLLAQNVNVNVWHMGRNTPLMAALWGGGYIGIGDEDVANWSNHVAVIEKLLTAGANVNMNPKGFIPLVNATRRIDQNVQLIEAILKFNPDLTLVDTFGKTAMYYAFNGGNPEVFKVFAKIPNLSELLPYLALTQEEQLKIKSRLLNE